MFKQSNLMFIYVETALHAGSGRGIGAVDLPIQRDKVTNYPMVQGSSLKGRLRAAIREKHNWEDEGPDMAALFGKAGGEGENWAGAISPGDAKLLLFPVRSLTGVFAWVTSVDVLARFIRDARPAGIKWDLNGEPGANQCWIAEQSSSVAASDQVTLEEFTFTSKPMPIVDEVAGWLAKHALPDERIAPEYDYWRKSLARHLVILPRDDFRDFTQYGTEIVTRVKLVPDIKTVQSGALWTEESLPADTLLYAPLAYGDSRMPDKPKSATEIGKILSELDGQRMQLGGDETTGRGMVMLRFLKSEVTQ